MNKKIVMYMGIFLISMFLIAGVSALQIRPMNQMNHPGLTDRYQPPAQGPNHVGVSDYWNVWTGISELCNWDKQLRPANQGKNTPTFYQCMLDMF